MLFCRTFGFLIGMMSSGVWRHALGTMSPCHAFGSYAQTQRPNPVVSRMFQREGHETYSTRQPFTAFANNHQLILRGGSSYASSSKLSASTQSKSLLSEKAKEAMSIAGQSSTASLRSFGGLTYRDSYSEREDFRVVFVLGGPGAGKGTQCELLKENYPCVHLSAGELLRAEASKKNASKHATLIEECLVQGKIVPVEISLALLQNAMKGADGKSLVFLIDGFPRNFDNLKGWTRMMVSNRNTDDENYCSAAVWGVLAYDCPLSILEERVMQRSKDSGRSDDNLESLRRRFKTFQAETVPVVDTMRLIQDETSLKVIDIAGDQSLEKVWEETQKSMNTFIANDVLSANMRLLEAAASYDVDTYCKLCADEMFENVYPKGANNDRNNESIVAPLTPSEIMATQEPSSEDEVVEVGTIKCAEMTFVTGTKVSLTYDRYLSNAGLSFKETRIWSHQGAKGWRMVHFFRKPLE
jgi:UMP-CMP kinase